MAVEERLELVSATTGADLSAASAQYKVVKLDTNGNVVAVSAITDIPFGILYDTAGTGKTVPVAVDGIVKCIAGATIAAGAVVATKADGTLQTAVTTQYILGTARYGAVAGDVFGVQIDTANPAIKA